MYLLRIKVRNQIWPSPKAWAPLQEQTQRQQTNSCQVDPSETLIILSSNWNFKSKIFDKAFVTKDFDQIMY